MRLIVIWLLFVSASAVYADSVKVNEVTSIYDADTFRVNIDAWPPIVGERVPVRVLGVDTPEIRGKCDAEKVMAKKAKQFTVEALRGAKRIELRHIKRGKYFRLLAEVYVDGVSLAQSLIKFGFGRPYSGGHRAGWC